MGRQRSRNGISSVYCSEARTRATELRSPDAVSLLDLSPSGSVTLLSFRSALVAASLKP